MAAAAMFIGGLDGGRDCTSPFVVVVVASQRLMDVLKGLVEFTPAEGNRFELTKIAFR